jgi:3-hydroxyisobutyrate dehydrogenase-like beta-hydroxyacid dehydrogenase
MKLDTVGFIGLGSMGTGMAQNLLKYCQSEGKTLFVFNRTVEKTEYLRAQGAQVANSIEFLAKNCFLIISILFNDESLIEVFDQLLKNETNNLYFVDCTTVYPETVKGLSQKAKKAGIHYYSMPVFGRPDAALNKLLAGNLAGEFSAVDPILGYLNSMTRAIIRVGEEPHLANALKGNI